MTWAQPRWAKPVLRCAFSRERMFPVWVMEETAAACRAWQQVCGIAFDEESSIWDEAADVLVHWKPLAPNRPAMSGIPGPDHTQPLHVHLSSTCAWRNLDAVAILTHELGHVLGLDHGPRGSLMYHEYDPAVRVPQEWDIREAVTRYGQPLIQTERSQP